jgi:hypothetical protein
MVSSRIIILRNKFFSAKVKLYCFYGAAEQYFSIIPFSAVATCDNFVWEYSGVDPADGHILNYSLDLMTVNSSTGDIRVA